MNLLTAYPWPGNVRELENVLEGAVVLANRDRITVAELPPAVRGGEPPSGLGVWAEPRSLANLEGRAILAAPERRGGIRTRVAREVGISLQAVWRNLKAYRSSRAEPQNPARGGEPLERTRRATRAS